MKRKKKLGLKAMFTKLPELIQARVLMMQTLGREIATLQLIWEQGSEAQRPPKLKRKKAKK